MIFPLTKGRPIFGDHLPLSSPFVFRLWLQNFPLHFDFLRQLSIPPLCIDHRGYAFSSPFSKYPICPRSSFFSSLFLDFEVVFSDRHGPKIAF